MSEASIVGPPMVEKWFSPVPIQVPAWSEDGSGTAHRQASGEMTPEAILAVMARYATYPASTPAPDNTD